MKTISRLADLEDYGIISLTGEACGLNMRVLCDVTDRGRKILAKCSGIPDLKLGDNWNSSTRGIPHVGSIMLDPMSYMVIGIFALLESGCKEVWLYQNGSLLGIEPGDPPDMIELWEKMAPEALARKFRYGGTAGSRNQHLMSGRIE